MFLQALPPDDAAAALVLMVPRHPQRFDAVAALLAQHAIAFQRRSGEEPVASDTRVLLGDSMGEMAAYFAACDIAIICGSFLPYGAHNLIEACALGKPVVVGPHDYNFAEAVRFAVTAGAAIQVDSAVAALAAARELLADRPRFERMAESGRAFVRLHAGSTQRILDLIKVPG